MVKGECSSFTPITKGPVTIVNDGRRLTHFWLENSLAWTQAIKYNQERGEVFYLLGKARKGGGVEFRPIHHYVFHSLMGKKLPHD